MVNACRRAVIISRERQPEAHDDGAKIYISQCGGEKEAWQANKNLFVWMLVLCSSPRNTGWLSAKQEKT